MNVNALDVQDLAFLLALPMTRYPCIPCAQIADTEVLRYSRGLLDHLGWTDMIMEWPL